MITFHDLRRVSPDTVGAWVDHIALHMRESDIDEVRASSDLGPHSALTQSVCLSSHAWMIESDKLGPIAMFGAAPHPLPGVGIVWMLGTEGIRKEGYSVARATRPYLDEMNAAYWMLWNFIDGRNAVSMRWLRWGGFKLLAEHPTHGPEGRPFFTFARTSLDV
jgi:hypothetical protein